MTSMWCFSTASFIAFSNFFVALTQRFVLVIAAICRFYFFEVSLTYSFQFHIFHILYIFVHIFYGFQLKLCSLPLTNRIFFILNYSKNCMQVLQINMSQYLLYMRVCTWRHYFMFKMRSCFGVGKLFHTNCVP